MADFDWVNARAQCSVVEIFERLKAQVSEDVKSADSLPTKRRQLKMQSNGGQFSVFNDNPFKYEAIVFKLSETSIDVLDESGNLKLTATPTLCDDGQCRLKVNGQERELWQVRKLALEKFFFAP